MEQIFGLARSCFQVLGEIGLLTELDVVGNFARNRRLPALHGTVIQRSVVGQRGIGNFSHDFAVLQHPHFRLADYAADGHGVESPLLENAEDFLFAAVLGDQQHALLRLAEHDLVGRHAGFALRHQVELDLQADAAAPAHLAGGTRQASRAHVLNADDRAGLHGFQAGFQQQLLQKRIADLHVGALGFRLFAEFLAGHGGAMNAVTARLGADVDYGIAFTCGLGVENLIAPHQSQREGVDQRIARVAAFELHLAADVRHAKTVAIRGDAAHHTFQHRVVLMQRGLIDRGCPTLIAFIWR